MRYVEVLSRLDEITDPHPELAALAREFAHLYADLRDRLLACAARIPGARPLRDRIVFDVAPPVDEPEESPARREVEAVLDRYGFAVEDWVTGTARRRSDGRTFAIGRVLNRLANPRDHPHMVRGVADAPGLLDPAEAGRLLRLFANDPARRKAAVRRRGGRLVAVLTMDPVENAHMSTRRGWVSCRAVPWAQRPGDPLASVDVEPGTLPAELECALSRGELVLWLTDADDAGTLDRPVGRTAVTVHVGPKGAVSLAPSESYGTLPPWWRDVVREITRRIDEACARVPGVYRVPTARWEAPRPEEAHLVGVGIADLVSALAREGADALDRLGIEPGDAHLIDSDLVGDPQDAVALARRPAEFARALDVLENELDPPPVMLGAFAALLGLRDPWLLGGLHDGRLAELVRLAGELSRAGIPLDPKAVRALADATRGSDHLRGLLAQELPEVAEEHGVGGDPVRGFLRTFDPALLAQAVRREGERALRRILERADGPDALRIYDAISAWYAAGGRLPAAPSPDVELALKRLLRAVGPVAGGRHPYWVHDMFEHVAVAANEVERARRRGDVDAVLRTWRDYGYWPLWVLGVYPENVARVLDEEGGSEALRELRCNEIVRLREESPALDRVLRRLRPDCR